MTYFEFFAWLTGIYSAYYFVNILWDLAKQKIPDKTVVNELTFTESLPPERISLKQEEVVETESPTPIIQPISKGFGGVTMKGLFDLAKTESINLTGSVTF